ncbi:TIR domain-containing protein [Streptomyces sp. NPDC005708]|uniref:toll/interleukin-1 receptor domain-containing protein n=1 Tax=Streptomyces sp. NPDC005708 TaxID=3154564 RepID=UPI0033E98895
MTKFWGGITLGKIFISHSSVDKPFIRRRIDAPLRAAGYDTWLDEKELLLGDPLPRKVSQGIRAAKVVIVVVSTASIDSNWLKYELNLVTDLVIKGSLRVIPVLIDDVQMPAELEGLLYADMRKGERGGLRRLIATLEAEVSRYPSPSDLASVASKNSYQRSRAYENLICSEADGGWFQASMDISATRSVDWNGITLLDVDVRVDFVHAYIEQVVLDSDDLTVWVSQLEETSDGFGILIIEGRIADELKSKLAQPAQGVWVQMTEAGLIRGGSAYVVVEAGAENPADQIEGRVRDAVRQMTECIADRKPSLWMTSKPAGIQ